MEYKILLKREAAKYLASLDKTTRNRITKAIKGLTVIPPEGDIAPMKGIEGWFRIRVGSFWIIFRPDEEEQTILITTIGPRGDVYKK